MPKKYDAEFKARAVRLVRDHVGGTAPGLVDTRG
jgi:transposase-like protein